MRDPTKTQSSTLSVDAKGQLVAHPMQTHKISSLDNWTDSFLIFASIYLEAHPNKTQQMLKYMNDIRLGAEKANWWVTYDEQYCLRMALNPSSNWGTIDSELKLVYINPNSVATQQSKQQVSTLFKCYDYNYRAVCQRIQCSYLHRCLKCNNWHPVIHCSGTQSSVNQYIANAQRPFRTNMPAPNVNQNSFQSFAARQLRPQNRAVGFERFPNKG